MKHARDKRKRNSANVRAEYTKHERSPLERTRSLEERRSEMQSVQKRRAESEKRKPIRKNSDKKMTASPKNKSRFFATLRVTLIIIILIAAVVILGVGAGMYASISKEIDAMDFEGIAYNFSSAVFANDENGNSVEITTLHSDGRREWIDSEEIPQVAKEAAISIEDERFFKHSGVDIKRTAGAVIGWIKAKLTGESPSYGGSTITQQVIKNITNEKDRTVTRKVKEMMRAVAFEKRFTKDEILTMYLNIVYFGNNCYGIEAASNIYFSKDAIDLSLEEAAMIVGITQAPSRFDPFRKPDETLKKRNTVLSKMYELEKITEEEYNEAVNSELGVNSRSNGIRSAVYNYFVDQLINDVISDLQTEKGYSRSFAEQQIFGGGLKIYTTMDSDIQEEIEKIYENTANFSGASRGMQSAMIIIDPHTGQIKGMVGGIGKKNESRGLNRATQAKRQAGSSIKPLSVYSPALETGKITAATIVTDEAINIGDWSPKNSYKGFKGDMTIRKALEISANIPAVKVLQSSGIENSYKFMTEKYHFTTLVNDDKNLSALGLGGLTKGVTPKEMAAAYATFANKGVYIEPHTYTKVLDSRGKVVLEKEPETTRVMSEANAFIMSSFLKDVVNGSAGTGRSARLSGMTTYGKTGTSNDSKDKWFVGFTSYYVGAVWCGYDQNNGSVSSSIPNGVWKKVMQAVHEGLADRAIEKPSNVTAVSVCQKTGKLSSNGCTYGKTEYFAKGTLPTKYCKNSGHGGTPIVTTPLPEVDPTDPSTSPSPEESPSVTGSPEPGEGSTTSPVQSASPTPTVKPATTPSFSPAATPATTPSDVSPKTPAPAGNQGDGVITLE